jgi:hypothetical protein
MGRAILVIAVALTGACEKMTPARLDASPPVVLSQDLDARLAQSLGVWRAMVSGGPADYLYSVEDSSFSGHSWRTIIEVRGDGVVGRTYTRWGENGRVADSWGEDLRTLGTHREGAPALTIDGLYERCRTELARDPAVFARRGYYDDNWEGLGLTTVTFFR